jgi:hypothetical protein
MIRPIPILPITAGISIWESPSAKRRQFINGEAFHGGFSLQRFGKPEGRGSEITSNDRS